MTTTKTLPPCEDYILAGVRFLRSKSLSRGYYRGIDLFEFLFASRDKYSAQDFLDALNKLLKEGKIFLVCSEIVRGSSTMKAVWEIPKWDDLKLFRFDSERSYSVAFRLSNGLPLAKKDVLEMSETMEVRDLDFRIQKSLRLFIPTDTMPASITKLWEESVSEKSFGYTISDQIIASMQTDVEPEQS